MSIYDIIEDHDRELLIEVSSPNTSTILYREDHRAIKPLTKPMLNFKSFRSATNMLAVIELMHMIYK
ncbi:MAG: hypothetical protein ABL933_14205 [Methyloglobulus sp.]